MIFAQALGATAPPQQLEDLLAPFLGAERAAALVDAAEASVRQRLKDRLRPFLPVAVGVGVVIVASTILSVVAISRSR